MKAERISPERLHARMVERIRIDIEYDRTDARREHAWRLREEGLTWRNVGDRLGISAVRAKNLHHRYLRGEECTG